MTEQTPIQDQDPVVVAPPMQEPMPVQPMAEPPARPVQFTPPPVPHAPPVTVKQKKTRVGVPGITGLGFTLSLLSLFLIPLYKEAFADYIAYEGVKEFFILYYYYATISLGGTSALFALLGLVLTPFGIHISRRRQRDGAALGVSGVLIAIVALILIAVVTASHVMLYGMIYPY